MSRKDRCPEGDFGGRQGELSDVLFQIEEAADRRDRLRIFLYCDPWLGPRHILWPPTVETAPGGVGSGYCLRRGSPREISDNN